MVWLSLPGLPACLSGLPAWPTWPTWLPGMCGCSKVHLSHSDLCHMVFAWYRNGWMQIWKKKLTTHRSVNTSIERKMKALESRFVWKLKLHLSHFDLCHMEFAWYRNGWMQIWKKKLTIHRSVNTNIQRKLKALELRFVWMLKHPFVPF